MIELLELKNNTLELFNIQSVDQLRNALLDVCKNNDTSTLKRFKYLIENDFSTDYLQMIFQYYQADRNEKKQDYTPKSLAKLLGRLAGNSEITIDMCSGSGALTIQKWLLDSNSHYILKEFDSNVIPYLLFNMMLRNIDCEIIHCDVLQDEVFAKYLITKGEEFGELHENADK